jgi:hypothetical protein
MLKIPESLEPYRIRHGRLGSDPGDNYGFFSVPSEAGLRRPLDLIICDGIDPEAQGWEHVSVKVRIGNHTYTPTWDEMCWVKSSLWSEEDCVIQFHPPKANYVNFHPNVLHLWRLINGIQPIPPKELIA